MLDEDLEAILEDSTETLEPMSDAYRKARRRLVFLSVVISAALAVATGAIVLYAAQELSDFRLANILTPRFVVHLAVGLSFGIALGTASNRIARRLANRAVSVTLSDVHPLRVYHRHYTGGFAISAGVILALGLATILVTPLDTVLLLVSAVGALAALLYFVLQDHIQWRRASRQ